MTFKSACLTSTALLILSISGVHAGETTQKALEKAGVEFTNGKRPGVRLAQKPVHRPYTNLENGQETPGKAAPIQYWLFKSEPDAWSWDQQKKEGAKGAEWDGVRNYQARNVMRQMRRGDLGFFYHSGEERRVVGVVKVVAEAHPDSTDGTGIWECVDVAAVSDVKKPVTLAEIKATKSLKDMVLVNNSRLSVQPVSAEEWGIVSRVAGLKAK